MLGNKLRLFYSCSILCGVFEPRVNPLACNKLVLMDETRVSAFNFVALDTDKKLKTLSEF
jgi:hypothetical protein